MKMRKIAALAMAALMLCSVMCGCANSQTGNTPGATTTAPTQPEKVMYQVAVYDIYGKPAVSGVAVRFMQNGEQIAMQSMNALGVAEKELPRGDYTVELKLTNTDVEYYYDTSDLTLTKTKTQLMIHLCMQQGEVTDQIHYDELDYDAYDLATGNTRVTLKPGRNFFLYVPTEPGEYEMFTEEGIYKVGYYGSPFFVQPIDQGNEAENNGTGLSLSPGMVTGENSFVIGVDNPGTEDVNTILRVVRTGDYIDTSIPSEIFKTTAALTPWKMTAGAQIKKFDVSAIVPYKLVKDESTGFYHLNSVTGPLVVVFLGKNAKQNMSYLVPYAEILENSGVSAYFQDENGNYIKREIYNECLMDYIGSYDSNLQNPDGSIGGYTGGCMDQQTGLYPLTDDLMHIIKEHGRSSGWWDIDDERYIFGDVTVNEENAWLFMCGYLG